jgi:hypothetical protein
MPEAPSLESVTEAIRRHQQALIDQVLEYAGAKGKGKPQIPNFNNATPSQLVDELGTIRELANGLKNLDKLYSAALKARMGTSNSAEGEFFSVGLTSVTQERIDSAKVREKLSEEELQEVISVVEMTQMRFNRKVKA